MFGVFVVSLGFGIFVENQNAMIKVSFYLNENSQIEGLVIDKITTPTNYRFFEMIKPALVESIKKIDKGLPIESRYKAKIFDTYVGGVHLDVDVITPCKEYVRTSEGDYHCNT